MSVRLWAYTDKKCLYNSDCRMDCDKCPLAYEEKEEDEEPGNGKETD